MAPRANWKGFPKLSLVTCPVALFPATSETEKITFNGINKQTGHRIKYKKFDAETGDEVATRDIIKRYKVDTDTYVTIDKDELENILLESTWTIDINEFVPRSEIDELRLVRPYYIVPDGKVGHDAYAVIRETIRTMDKVATARVVLNNREHIIALEARGKGLVSMLLRYPYEIRDENEYFDDIQDVTKEMLDLASHIVETKSADFEPGKVRRPLRKPARRTTESEAQGKPVRTAVKSRDTGNVINLMDALRKSLMTEEDIHAFGNEEAIQESSFRPARDADGHPREGRRQEGRRQRAEEIAPGTRPQGQIKPTGMSHDHR